MIACIVKFLLLSGIFLAVYKCFFEKEKLHGFKRFYLLLAWMVSLILPLVSFHVKSSPIVPQATIAQHLETFSPTRAKVVFDNNRLLLVAYLAISSVIFIKFISNLMQVTRTIRSYPIVERRKNLKIVRLPDTMQPFSFFNYVALNGQDIRLKEGRAILLHETTHARQWHSLDILFMEAMKIFFWFNPFVFLYKRAIQLNHEFLADEYVLGNATDKVSDYQKLLLNRIRTAHTLSPLVSSSVYGITKSRFLVMARRTGKVKAVGLVSLFFILLLAMVVSFGCKVIPTIPGPIQVVAKKVPTQQQPIIPDAPIKSSRSRTIKTNTINRQTLILTNLHTIDTSRIGVLILEKTSVPDSLKTLYVQY